MPIPEELLPRTPKKEPDKIKSENVEVEKKPLIDNKQLITSKELKSENNLVAKPQVAEPSNSLQAKQFNPSASLGTDNEPEKTKKSFQWRLITTRILPIFLGVVLIVGISIAAVPPWREAFNNFLAKFSPQASEISTCESSKPSYLDDYRGIEWAPIYMNEKGGSSSAPATIVNLGEDILVKVNNTISASCWSVTPECASGFGCIGAGSITLKDLPSFNIDGWPFDNGKLVLPAYDDRAPDAIVDPDVQKVFDWEGTISPKESAYLITEWGNPVYIGGDFDKSQEVYTNAYNSIMWKGMKVPVGGAAGASAGAPTEGSVFNACSWTVNGLNFACSGFSLDSRDFSFKIHPYKSTNMWQKIKYIVSRTDPTTCGKPQSTTSYGYYCVDKANQLKLSLKADKEIVNMTEKTTDVNGNEINFGQTNLNIKITNQDGNSVASHISAVSPDKDNIKFIVDGQELDEIYDYYLPSGSKIIGVKSFKEGDFTFNVSATDDEGRNASANTQIKFANEIELEANTEKDEVGVEKSIEDEGTPNEKEIIKGQNTINIKTKIKGTDKGIESDIIIEADDEFISFPDAHKMDKDKWGVLTDSDGNLKLKIESSARGKYLIKITARSSGLEDISKTINLSFVSYEAEAIIFQNSHSILWNSDIEANKQYSYILALADDKDEIEITIHTKKIVDENNKEEALSNRNIIFKGTIGPISDNFDPLSKYFYKDSVSNIEWQNKNINDEITTKTDQNGNLNAFIKSDKAIGYTIFQIKDKETYPDSIKPYFDIQTIDQENQKPRRVAFVISPLGEINIDKFAVGEYGAREMEEKGGYYLANPKDDLIRTQFNIYQEKNDQGETQPMENYNFGVSLPGFTGENFANVFVASKEEDLSIQSTIKIIEERKKIYDDILAEWKNYPHRLGEDDETYSNLTSKLRSAEQYMHEKNQELAEYIKNIKKDTNRWFKIDSRDPNWSDELIKRINTEDNVITISDESGNEKEVSEVAIYWSADNFSKSKVNLISPDSKEKSEYEGWVDYYKNFKLESNLGIDFTEGDDYTLTGKITDTTGRELKNMPIELYWDKNSIDEYLNYWIDFGSYRSISESNIDKFGKITEGVTDGSGNYELNFKKPISGEGFIKVNFGDKDKTFSIIDKDRLFDSSLYETAAERVNNFYSTWYAIGDLGPSSFITLDDLSNSKSFDIDFIQKSEFINNYYTFHEDRTENYAASYANLISIKEYYNKFNIPFELQNLWVLENFPLTTSEQNEVYPTSFVNEDIALGDFDWHLKGLNLPGNKIIVSDELFNRITDENNKAKYCYTSFAHEFAHYVNYLLNKEYFIVKCINDYGEYDRNHFGFYNSCSNDSFAEGFANFMMNVSYNEQILNKSASQSDVYLCGKNNPTVNLETNWRIDEPYFGSSRVIDRSMEESSFASLLWDLYDGINSTDKDNFQISDYDVLKLLFTTRQLPFYYDQNGRYINDTDTTFRGAGFITDVYNNLINDYSSQKSQIDDMFLDRRMFLNKNGEQRMDFPFSKFTIGDIVGIPSPSGIISDALESTRQSIREYRRSTYFNPEQVVNLTSNEDELPYTAKIKITVDAPYDYLNQEYDVSISEKNQQIYISLPPQDYKSIYYLTASKEGFQEKQVIELSSDDFWEKGPPIDGNLSSLTREINIGNGEEQTIDNGKPNEDIVINIDNFNSSENAEIYLDGKKVAESKVADGKTNANIKTSKDIAKGEHNITIQGKSNGNISSDKSNIKYNVPRNKYLDQRNLIIYIVSFVVIIIALIFFVLIRKNNNFSLDK